MDGLPTVPDGANPYTVYREFLESQLYPTYSDGFKVRMLVLLVMTSLFTAMALGYLIYLVVESTRVKAGTSRAQPLRPFTTVDRPSGRYLVVNQKASMAICSILSGGCLIAFFYNAFDVLVNKADQSVWWSLRAFIFLPLFMHGWLAAWGALQAFILTTDSGHVKGKFWLSARVSNCLFVGLGGFLVACGAAVSLIGMLSSLKLWQKFVKVRDGLSALEASYTGTLDFAGLLQLTPLFTDLESYANKYTTLAIVECATYAVLCAAILVVLVGGFGMSQVLQKNINYHSSGMSRAHEKDINPGTSTVKSFSKKQSISHADIRSMANATDGPAKDRAQLVLSLDKARRDLISISAILTGAATLALALLAFICWMTASKHNGTWWMYELSLIGIGWIYCVPMCATFLSLYWNAWIARSSTDSAAIDRSAHQAVTSLGPAPPSDDEKPSIAPSQPFSPVFAKARQPIQIGANRAPFPAPGKTGVPVRRDVPRGGPVGMESFLMEQSAVSIQMEEVTPQPQLNRQQSTDPLLDSRSF